MAEIVLRGGFANNGTYFYCEGCNLTSMMPFQTVGIQGSIVMASVVLKAIFTVGFLLLSICAAIWVPAVYYQDSVSRTTWQVYLPGEGLVWVPGLRYNSGRTTVHLSRSTLFVAFAIALYAVCIIVPELAEKTKAAVLILFPIYVFFALFAELSVAACLTSYLDARTKALREERRPRSTSRFWGPLIPLIEFVISILLFLIFLGRVVFTIVITTISFKKVFSQAEYDLALEVLTGLGIAAKLIYLWFGIEFVLDAFRIYRRQKASGPQSAIPKYTLCACLVYLVWALCGLVVFLMSAYSNAIPLRGSHFVSTFTYDLPLFACQLLLVLGGLQRDWFFDLRGDDDHGVAETYDGPDPTGHRAETKA